MTGWAARFFRREIFSPDEPGARAQAPAEARFVFRALGLKRGDRLLDVCCGAGRHSFELARRGVLVTGVDASLEYLRLAGRRGGRLKNPVFSRGDMRRLPFDGEFDAAINLWTSFGYFKTPAQDLAALRGMRRALKPGGRLLIDVLNADWMRANFSPRRCRPAPGGGVVLEEAQLRGERDFGIESVWTVSRRGAPRVSAPLSLRLYDERRLSAALRAAGFEVLRSWGGLEDLELSNEMPRLVILSRRKRQAAASYPH